MRRMLLLVAKDLRRKRRAPTGLIVLLLFPLLFAGMLALVFGRGGEGVPKVRLLVHNADDGLGGRLLLGALGSEQMAEFFDVRSVGDEGRALMEEGEASALLTIPTGFTRDLLDGKPITLSLVRNPAEGILPEIAEQTASILAEILDGGARVLREPLDDLSPFFREGSEGPDDLQVTEISLAFKRAIEGTGAFVFPPAIELPGALETAPKDTEAKTTRAEGMAEVFLLILPGIAVYALFLVGDSAMRDVLVEIREGTLRRQLAGPIGPGALVAAKAVYTAVLSLLALAILSLVTAAVLRRTISVPGYLLLSSGIVLAVAGASSVIYGFARTERRGATVASVIYVAMAFIGGSFVPLDSLPRVLRTIAPITPFYWGTTGYLKLMRDGAGLAEVLPNAASLAALGVVLLAIGAVALGRAVRSGAAA